MKERILEEINWLLRNCPNKYTQQEKIEMLYKLSETYNNINNDLLK